MFVCVCSLFSKLFITYKHVATVFFVCACVYTVCVYMHCVCVCVCVFVCVCVKEVHLALKKPHNVMI